MKFGKLPDISNVDFSLPKDPDFNATIFQNLSKNSNPKLYIGCTGWSMKEWVGTVYPKGAKTKEYLHHYSRQFNTIELNTTHYRIPNEATIQKWVKESPDDFRFCPKVLQYISHSRDLGMNSSRILEFCDSVVGLEEKLGCCFIQLPPYFGVDKIKLLELFLDRWYSEIPLAIEVRHESWFNNSEHLSSLLNLLNLPKYKSKMGLVLTDVAGRRDVLSMGITASFSVVRFVGNGLHETDYSRIDEWVERLKVWFQKGLEEVYFFTHEPDNILAPELALYLFEKAKEIPNLEVRGPKLEEEQGGQMSLF